MSLILDALNRSRQDVGDVPGIDSQHLVAQEPRALANRLWPLALLIALVVIGYLLYERGDTAGPVIAEHVPVTLETGQRTVVSEESVPRPEVPAASVATGPDTPVVVKKALPTTVTPVQSAVPDAAVAALYTQKGQAANNESVAEAVKPQKKKATQAQKKPEPTAAVTPAPELPSEELVDLEKMVQLAEDELEDTRLEEHTAPFLASLSQQTKDGIPTIFYERHDYSGNPAQSSVVLNGRKVVKGGKTSTGVRVDEILADSVVLSYQGTQFRLRALNSWVNL